MQLSSQFTSKVMGELSKCFGIDKIDPYLRVKLLVSHSL